MNPDVIQQEIVAATGGTLTGANYVEDTMIKIVSPDSLLDYQLITTLARGLSIRDVVFIVTAIITIRAARKYKKIKDNGDEK